MSDFVLNVQPLWDRVVLFLKYHHELWQLIVIVGAFGVAGLADKFDPEGPEV
jgi:hypothetical protein